MLTLGDERSLLDIVNKNWTAQPWRLAQTCVRRNRYQKTQITLASFFTFCPVVREDHAENAKGVDATFLPFSAALREPPPSSGISAGHGVHRSNSISPAVGAAPCGRPQSAAARRQGAHAG